MSSLLSKLWRFAKAAPMAAQPSTPPPTTPSTSPSTTPSILSLGDDVLLNVFELLSSEEILALRKSCSYLSCVSQARYLWNHFLRRDVIQAGKALPWYSRALEELPSRGLESLARHALRLDSPSSHYVINRLDQAKESISWLHVVHGQWLLVATRNVTTKRSMLTAYSVSSVQSGRPIALVAADLPGPVSSGEIEVQADQLVMTLCFQVPERMVVVMSIRSHGEMLAFHELARFRGLSHVKCLRGDYFGCAIQGEATVPCIANWKTGECFTVPELAHDARCLSMALRDGVCAVATSDALHIYSLPTDGGECTLLQVLPLSHVAESVAFSKGTEDLHSSETDSSRSRFQVFVTNKLGLYVYRVLEDAEGSFAAEVVSEREEPADASSRSSRPAYPCFGNSSSQVAWIYPPTSLFDRQSRLVTAKIQRDPTPAASCAAKLSVLFESNSAELPSLYAMPVMDFDDGAGLLAIGNGFGHLALYSFGGVLPPDYSQCLQRLPTPTSA